MLAGVCASLGWSLTPACPLCTHRLRTMGVMSDSVPRPLGSSQMPELPGEDRQVHEVISAHTASVRLCLSCRQSLHPSPSVLRAPPLLRRPPPFPPSLHSGFALGGCFQLPPNLVVLRIIFLHTRRTAPPPHPAPLIGMCPDRHDAAPVVSLVRTPVPCRNVTCWNVTSDCYFQAWGSILEYAALENTFEL